MPASPTPAQADASRRNGALSQGPVTPEGRAASAGNAARHGLRSAAPPRLLPNEDAAAYAALRDALSTRHNPADAAEMHCVEELAFAYWRQRRLRALEIAALDAADPVAEPDGAAPRGPAPATLARYRARIERDIRLASAELARLQALRPRLPRDLARAGAEQLRYLADRLDAKAAALAPAPEAAPSQPVPGQPDREQPRPATPAPERVPEDARTNPTPPAPAPLNRHQRRRFAALDRIAA